MGKVHIAENATKFCEILTLLLFYVVPVKSKLKILQIFVAFSEYMNFKSSHETFVLSSLNSGLHRHFERFV